LISGITNGKETLEKHASHGYMGGASSSIGDLVGLIRKFINSIMFVPGPRIPATRYEGM
jgi:hypothetical protein